MKLGLDIHGVISSNANFYSLLSNLALERGHEVHILTGVMLTDEKLAELNSYGVTWSHLFSISDFHKNLGTSMTFTDPNNPWIDNILWDKTKADYCENQSIDFHIDDTERYGEYFKTPFGLYDFENHRIDWHLKNEKNGVFTLSTPEEILKIIERIVDNLKITFHL